MENRVVAVVVAYNRAELLERCLRALAAQTRPVDTVVVVDNASTDASATVARDGADDVVELPRNTGGAGGFAVGIARALRHHDPVWLWIMDDDTIPEPDALEALLTAAAGYGRPAVLASAALWHDGRRHPMNTHRERPLISPSLRSRASAVGAVQVRAASFVSILVEARAARQVGLPEADYFIWNDDLEYTARILTRRVGLSVPASRVLHATKAFGDATADPGERFHYEVRNKIWFLRSSGLRCHDRVLWGGSTLLRWLRMLARSRDRRAMAGRLAAGLREGLGSSPRPNVQVLAGLGGVTDDVAAIERAAGR